MDKFDQLYIERWRDLTEKLGVEKNCEGLFRFVVEKYSEKHRKYHNLNHLIYCIKRFDTIKDKLISKDLVEFAIWLHDIFYNTRSDKNEESSAMYAKKVLKDNNVEKASVEKVYNLILGTKHDLKIVDSDSAYLNDIDLSILGDDEDVFLEYEKNIRKEYKWVPFFYYKKKRFDILESFIKRKFIYNTDYFRQKLEIRARSNINSVLKIYRKIYS